MANHPTQGTMSPGLSEGPSTPQNIQQNSSQIPASPFPAQGPNYGQQFGQPTEPTQQFGQPIQANSTARGRSPCCCELECGILSIIITATVYCPIIAVLYIYSYMDGCRVSVKGDFPTGTTFFTTLVWAGGLFGGICLTIGSAKKSFRMVRTGWVEFFLSFFGYITSYIVYIADLSLTSTKNFAELKVAKWTYIGFVIAFFIIGLAVYIYIFIVIYAYMNQLMRSIQVGFGQQMPNGQFPAGPPPPNQLYYQPSVPTMGYSQTSMTPGGGQQPQSGPPTQP